MFEYMGETKKKKYLNEKRGTYALPGARAQVHKFELHASEIDMYRVQSRSRTGRLYFFLNEPSRDTHGTRTRDTRRAAHPIFDENTPQTCPCTGNADFGEPCRMRRNATLTFSALSCYAYGVYVQSRDGTGNGPHYCKPQSKKLM